MPSARSAGGTWCAREVHCPSVVRQYNLNQTGRLEYLPTGSGRRGAQRKGARRDKLSSPAHGPGADKGLVTLDVHYRGVSLKPWLIGDFRHPLGSRRVFVTGHDALRPLSADNGCDRVIVCGNDDGIGDIHLRDSLPNPDDEGKSGKETERFAGKAHGTEPCRYHN